MKPIKLTDAELDAVFSAARPLDPDLRDPFLQAVAHALQQDCSGEIGPGTVARRLPRDAAAVLRSAALRPRRAALGA